LDSIVCSRKYPYQPYGLFSAIPKFLKESMKLVWNFQRGGGAHTKKTIYGGGMDIFWNNTFRLNAATWHNY